jgi:hypothetical protein
LDATEIPELAKAINRWLSYQLLCGREALLSEAYLGQPLAEFFIHRHGGEFRTEVDHPVLNKPGPGRPRQIDYVLHTPHSEIVEVAIECKWISHRPYDKQRIINDILRLECVRVPHRYVRRFFVVAGLGDNFKQNFASLEVVGRVPFTRGLLSFARRRPSVTVDARNSNEELRPFYKRFKEAFDADVPKSFKTTLIGSRTADEVSVFVWQIGSSKNRTLFSPAKIWPDN